MKHTKITVQKHCLQTIEQFTAMNENFFFCEQGLLTVLLRVKFRDSITELKHFIKIKLHSTMNAAIMFFKFSDFIHFVGKSHRQIFILNVLSNTSRILLAL